MPALREEKDEFAGYYSEELARKWGCGSYSKYYSFCDLDGNGSQYLLNSAVICVDGRIIVTIFNSASGERGKAICYIENGMLKVEKDYITSDDGACWLDLIICVLE